MREVLEELDTPPEPDGDTGAGVFIDALASPVADCVTRLIRCTVSSEVAGVRWEIVAPRDLKFYGALCRAVPRQEARFRAPDEFVVSDRELTLIYSGDERCGRLIVERFVKTDNFERLRAATFVANTYGLWRSCSLTSSNSVACSEPARFGFHAGQDVRLAQIEAWAAHQ